MFHRGDRRGSGGVMSKNPLEETQAFSAVSPV